MIDAILSPPLADFFFSSWSSLDLPLPNLIGLSRSQSPPSLRNTSMPPNSFQNWSVTAFFLSSQLRGSYAFFSSSIYYVRESVWGDLDSSFCSDWSAIFIWSWSFAPLRFLRGWSALASSYLSFDLNKMSS